MDFVDSYKKAVQAEIRGLNGVLAEQVRKGGSCMRSLRLFALSLLPICVQPALAVPDECDVCGQALGSSAFTVVDQVDHTKKWLCESCAELTTVCYMCGVPTREGYLTLSDGRVVCRRDRVDVVSDATVALRVCAEANQRLQSLFSRFTSFPDTNVYVRLADRIEVRTLVGVAGHDFKCPNLLGYTLSLQKPGYLQHNIRLLTGLTKGQLRATCAHELAHAWVAENVGETRQLGLHPDAIEGFCELMGYLVAKSYGDERTRQFILANQYTRGQVLLFIEAERHFGVGDVFDWMQYGRSGFLRKDDLYAIRDVTLPSAGSDRPVSEILFIPKGQATRLDRLRLTSVTIGPNRSIATINGRDFGVNEERKVSLGGSNVVLRCLSIETNCVLVERLGSGRRQRLPLGPSEGWNPE